MAESKKHHFVPQFLLKNFTEERKDLLHIFDKMTEQGYASSVNNAGHENNFNAIAVAGEKFNFEDIYGGFEAAAAPIIKQLTEAETHFQLSVEEAYTLSLFVCVQQIRTKLARTTVQQFARDILDWMQSDSRKFETTLQPITDEQSKLIALGRLDEIEERVAVLLSKAIVLFRAPADKPLWISDNPVVLNNDYPYGRLGLGTPGTSVYMPLSKTLALGFMCRIDADKIVKVVDSKTACQQPIDPEIQQWYDAIQFNLVLDMASAHVDFLNSLQVLYSSRFLYGPSGDFSMAREMIAENTKLKTTITTLGVGQEREYPRMPPGEHIVFHLPDDHFILPVTLDLQASPAHLVFTTAARPLVLFAFFMEKTSISSIEVYKDQKMIRLMREVLVQSVEKVPSGIQVRIRHADEAIHTIISQMKSKKANL